MRIGIGHVDPDPDTGRLDVAARALTDALLGAAGIGHGGAASPREEAATAVDVLSRAVRAVEGQNYQVVNVDLAVTDFAPGESEAGGDGPGDHAIRDELADRLHVSPDHVSLEPGGSGAVMAVAMLDRIAPMDQVHSALRAGG